MSMVTNRSAEGKPASDQLPELQIQPVAPSDGETLIAQLLLEQQNLTAVEEFSRYHDEHSIPDRALSYSKLLPVSPPGEGEQYAFEVDLDRCSGCKACVTACHSMNGLEENEAWRDVGLLVGGTTTHPVMQHVTTACHHCLQPGCMIACPVNAYEKDPETGIVKHLDDQCFGCQYCTLACPYDVPKFLKSKGIVRKCDMCSDRLASGEAPACVQACPHEAISITTVNKRQVLENSEADHFLPAAPEPYLTMPTTTYKSKRIFPRNTLPADYYDVNPQHPHWPLIVMLVLTQLSVGAFLVGQILDGLLPFVQGNAMRPVHATMAFSLGLLALGASVFHLGRPLYAFRAILGLKHSWLSREILAFGLFAKLALVYAVCSWLMEPANPWLAGLGWSVAVSGTVAVFCSVMIYVFTRREFWSATQTGCKFLLTSGVLGIATAWLSLLILNVTTASADSSMLVREAGPILCRGLIVTVVLKLAFELSLFSHLLSFRTSPLKRTARLMVGPLSNITLARFACGFLGGVVMPSFLLTDLNRGDIPMLIVVAILFVACLIGELLERFLFFAAVSAPRMPGGLRP
ncbi:MAG: dimethyl sulfoxide reductase anchor subunit [Planctomycetaceae bacterium]